MQDRDPICLHSQGQEGRQRRRAWGHNYNGREPQVTVEHPHHGEQQGRFKLKTQELELEEAFQRVQVKPLILQMRTLCAKGDSAG